MTESKQTVRTVSLVIIAFVAMCAALFFGREFFVPIAVAVLFGLIFRPVVRAMERVKIPTMLASGIVVLTILGIFTFAGWMLADPVQNWLHQVPQRLKEAESKLDQIRKPFQAASQAAASLQHATTENVTARASSEPATNRASRPVGAEASPAVDQWQPAPAPSQPLSIAPSTIASGVGTTATVLGEIVEVILLLFLLLATGDLFLQKLVKILPRVTEKQKAIAAVHDVEVAVLRYVVTISLINLVQAAVIGIALWLLGVPSPIIWAIGAFVLEFIPYLGGMMMIGLLSIVAFATFDSLGRVVAVPASYLLVTTTQNSAISPFAYGKRLKLNPVAVLVGVIFWWFVWGVAGAFLAVPIVATAKIVCDRVQALKPVGEFLGE